MESEVCDDQKEYPQTESGGGQSGVRLKQNAENYIRNALEAGAQGVVIPHVATREDAEKAVKYARFAPRGVRGAEPNNRLNAGDLNLEEGAMCKGRIFPTSQLFPANSAK